ncbi:MAG: hypothetical protein ACQCN6_01525 [Candidatus Bathyarchaeia archaeon]|jgi:hypothetical protein
MQTIKCRACGAEILLVPDVALMAEAINRHAAEHRASGNVLEGLVRLDLTQQAVAAAAATPELR